jgi:UDP-N-acetylglucosamine 2-epimerase
MKILTVVGARPQFIKAAAVEHAFRDARKSDAAFQTVLVHTGQHYDYGMSQVFFEELGLPEPNYDLGIGSGTHGMQTGRMLEALESVLLAERPQCVLVYGDTNSTLAGALAASKLHIPVAHVEAGLRSFNRQMPEEINRVLTDHLSQWLFCPTPTAVENLEREGIHDGVAEVGDVMHELVTKYAPLNKLPAEWERRGIRPGGYALATIHRAENTDDADRLSNIVSSLVDLSRDVPVVLPLHPRTRKVLSTMALDSHPRLVIVEPLSYGAMIASERNAALVLTDSGGVQKEAFWLGIPCVTLRDETEWLETLDNNHNRLAGANRSLILSAARQQLETGRFTPLPVERNSAASDIVRTLVADVA